MNMKVEMSERRKPKKIGKELIMQFAAATNTPDFGLVLGQLHAASEVCTGIADHLGEASVAQVVIEVQEYRSHFRPKFTFIHTTHVRLKAVMQQHTGSIVWNKVFAEIIYISSSESSSEGPELPMPWEDYLPIDYCGSGSKKEDARRIKTPKQLARKNDDIMAKTSKQIAKEDFNARVKVLGLPNAHFCEEIGMKPFAKDGSKGKGKKN